MKIKYYLLGALLILCYMLPYLILGEDAYITIHDFLDQEVGIIADLKNNGILTSMLGTVPNMDGLDRTLFQSFTPFDIKMVCSYLLPPYWAIICYTYLYKLLAFVGMFLLVDTYIMNRQHRWMAVWVSIMLALVPFYVLHGLSGIGLPLVIYAFLNLYHSRRLILSYVLIAVYTFNSMLAYGGFFALVILFVFLCWDYYKNRVLRKHILYGAAMMCIVYVFANWGTLYSMFFSESFVSHRTEWGYPSGWASDIHDFLRLILISNYHAGSMLSAPILILFCYLIWKYHDKYPLLKKVAIFYLLVIGGIVGGVLLKHSHIHLFVEVQFNRFYFFYPVVIILLLSSCCMVFLLENKKRLAVLLIFFGFISVISFDGEFRENVVMRMLGVESKKPSYRQFFDTKVFSEIHKELRTKWDYNTKVVSVGIFPSVAEYNGFYTIDSYRVNYPVEYKQRFRKVIAKELDKSEYFKDYFDKWGSRCYIFSSELENQNNPYLCGKKEELLINHLDINVDALKELGCQYIFSAVDIKNYKELKLKYINSYTTDNSFWNIRVYMLR